MRYAGSLTTGRVLWTLGWGAALALGAAGLLGVFSEFRISSYATTRCIALWCWAMLAAYALLLWRWRPPGTDRSIRDVLAPLLLVVPSLTTSFFMAALFLGLVLAWIRSGVLFRAGGWKGLLLDALLTLCAMVVLAILGAGSAYAWELGLWGFACLQGAMLHLPWVQAGQPMARATPSHLPPQRWDDGRYEALKHRVETLLAKDV